MEMKVIIPVEEIVPKISHLTLQQVHNLLEDYIINKIPDVEIFSKYGFQLENEDSILEIIPWFRLEDQYCSNCGKMHLYEANEKREVIRRECEDCGPKASKEPFNISLIKGMALLNYRNEQKKKANLSDKHLKKALVIPSSMVI